MLKNETEYDNNVKVLSEVSYNACYKRAIIFCFVNLQVPLCVGRSIDQTPNLIFQKNDTF